VSEPGSASPAIRAFSSMWASSFMPERATTTSGWFHTQRSAHSAGDRRTSASFQIAATSSGTTWASLPPRRGSITITPTRFSAA